MGDLLDARETIRLKIESDKLRHGSTKPPSRPWGELLPALLIENLTQVSWDKEVATGREAIWEKTKEERREERKAARRLVKEDMKRLE